MSFDNTVWMGPDGKLRTGEVPAGQQDNLWATGFFNGQTQDALRRCSCSIDAIAEQLPYDDYVRAETVLRLQGEPGGGRTAMFRTAPWAQAMIDKLRTAQVEADLRCF